MLNLLSLSHFRNITQAEIQPANGINLLLGENGSGKTSVLEAIFMLAMGRSFRSRSLKHAVQQEQQRLLLFTRTIDTTPIGLQFDLHSGLQIRLNNAPLKKLSELVSHIPLQFIPANCHQYFEQGPRFRRRMVDWGVFHLEQSFNFHWQSYKKALQQRNAAIKQGKSDAEIRLWDHHLVTHGEKITQQRQAYLHTLIQHFRPIFNRLCPELAEKHFSLRYGQGWNKETAFADYLALNLARDRILGYTRYGPHAADWSLRVAGADPYEMLSRGQQKLFFLALSLAQIALVSQYKSINQSILLIDDLSSELDWNHQITVIESIRQLPVQTFISSTQGALSQLLSESNEHAFHVKQGEIF